MLRAHDEYKTDVVGGFGRTSGLQTTYTSMFRVTFIAGLLSLGLASYEVKECSK